MCNEQHAEYWSTVNVMFHDHSQIICQSCLRVPFLQIVMSPHEQAEEFIASYTKLMHEDTDISNFQKVLEMKVCTRLVHSTFYTPI